MKKGSKILIAVIVLLVILAAGIWAYGYFAGDGNTDNGDTDNNEFEGCMITVDYADDTVLPSLGEYDEFSATDSEYGVKLIIASLSRVKNFKLLSLTFESADDEGNIVFSANELYSVDSMTPEKPLVAEIEFIGTIPNTGFSYEDGNGNTYAYSIGMSGMDSSIIVDEITVK